MKQRTLFNPESPTVRHPGEPAVWLKRLVLLRSRDRGETPVRDIDFRLGLNIIRVAEPGEGVGRAFGHNVGKTLLVRLIRYCLGDSFFADLTARERIRLVLPDGWVAAVVRVRGIDWAVARPLARRLSGWCVEADDWTALLGDNAALRPYAAFQEALADLVPADFARVRLEGPDRPPAWTDLLGWLARDQHCRYTHHAHWRHADAESGVAALSLGDANLLMRLTMGLFDAEERRQTADLTALRAEAQRLEVGIDRERLGAELLRQGLLANPGLTDVPDGQLFIESLRAQIAHCREPLQRSLEGADELRAYEESERRLAASRSEADRTAGRLEELRRRRQRAVLLEVSRSRDALSRARLSCGLQGCLHLTGGPLPDLLREEFVRALAADAADLEREESEVSAALAGLELEAARARTERDLAHVRYEKAVAGLRQTLAGYYAAMGELERYSACQARLASLENRLRANGDRERELERKREARAEGWGRALADLNALFAVVTEALLCRPAGGLVLNLRDGLAPRADEVAGEAFGTAARVIGFDLTCMLATMLGRGAHPRLLIHDSPREADMHQGIYENLYRFVRGLEERFPGKEPAFQYLITTTTPPPDEMGAAPWVRETLNAATPQGLLLRAEF
jgi:hypothetical protein